MVLLVEHGSVLVSDGGEDSAGVKVAKLPLFH